MKVFLIPEATALLVAVGGTSGIGDGHLRSRDLQTHTFGFRVYRVSDIAGLTKACIGGSGEMHRLQFRVYFWV